jgi:uncharacterized UBP type Zn finger protein
VNKDSSCSYFCVDDSLKFWMSQQGGLLKTMGAQMSNLLNWDWISHLQCAGCGEFSDVKIEHVTELMIPLVPSEKAEYGSVQKLLNELFRREKLEWACPLCSGGDEKRKSMAYKYTALGDALPCYLMIVLKRFAFLNGGGGSKDSTLHPF